MREVKVEEAKFDKVCGKIGESRSRVEVPSQGLVIPRGVAGEKILC